MTGIDASHLHCGVDLGGTKIEAIVLDDAGETLFRERVPSPSHDYQEILRAVRDLVRDAERETARDLRVGICTPGALSPKTQLLRNSNTVCMNGQPLLKDLERSLQRPMRIANDANCFTLSEAVDGAAAEASLVFGVIIGTGTGGGIVWDRRIHTGPHAIAGEWAHNPLPWPQPFDIQRPCYCGKQGCIETFVSGPGMAANARALSGRDLTSHQIVAGAREGDAVCVELLDHYCDQLARGLAHVINILDPDMIVLGGGMSNIDEIYQQVPQRPADYVLSDFVRTPIVPPRFGDSSGVRGAAWLWGLDGKP